MSRKWFLYFTKFRRPFLALAKYTDGHHDIRHCVDQIIAYLAPWEFSSLCVFASRKFLYPDQRSLCTRDTGIALHCDTPLLPASACCVPSLTHQSTLPWSPFHVPAAHTVFIFHVYSVHDRFFCSTRLELALVARRSFLFYQFLLSFDSFHSWLSHRVRLGSHWNLFLSAGSSLNSVFAVLHHFKPSF